MTGSAIPTTGRRPIRLAWEFISLVTQPGPRRSRRLRVVTMDMWQGYIGSVKAHASLADIVFDRFHIERYLTQAVDEVRKQEFFRRGGAYRTRSAARSGRS